MIASLKQSLPISLARARVPALRMVASMPGRAALLTLGLGFFCIMPYASLPVGGNSAIQIGNLFTIVMAMFLLVIAWRGKPFWIYPLLLLPLYLSTLCVGVVGEANLELCFKSTVVWTLSLLTIVVAQHFAVRHPVELLSGLAAATLIHAAIGIWQWFVFPSGVIPLLWIYINPSFYSVQIHADALSRYAMRPFGLFPEPSAMASSLAPWILFWTAYLLGLVPLRVQPARWQRALFAAAASAGIFLIIISQSGHSAVTLLAVGVFVLAWFVRSRATLGTYLAIVFGSVAGSAALWLAANSLSRRIGRKTLGNSSWEDRSNSLILGFTEAFGSDPLTALFGLGPGLSAVALYKVSEFVAVWSVLLTYLYETGIIGFVAVSGIAFYLLRTWKASRFNMAFAAIFLVWLVGITITTSYDQLLSLWVTLGWLTIWPAICSPAPVAVHSQQVDLPGSPFAPTEEPLHIRTVRPRMRGELV